VKTVFHDEDALVIPNPDNSMDGGAFHHHGTKQSATNAGIPYQNLINLYLLDCAKAGRRLSLTRKK